MAQTIYDYWFVQFDFPDENGRPYKSSGGKMVWNEKLRREIPVGWDVDCLNKCIKTTKTGEWGEETAESDDSIRVNCFRGADFISITNTFQTSAPVRFISKKKSHKILSNGDLVIETSGGSPKQSTGRIGYISDAFLQRNENRMTCSNFCKAITPTKQEYQYWLYLIWEKCYRAGSMFNYESQTSGIKNFRIDQFLNDFTLPIPPFALVKSFYLKCSAYFDRIQECLFESANLATQRDDLLPLLMNGQVEIRE